MQANLVVASLPFLYERVGCHVTQDAAKRFL
jgi:hypothetical protein